MVFPFGLAFAQPVLSPCAHQPEPIPCTRRYLQETFAKALADLSVEGTLVFSLTIDSLGHLSNVDLLRDLDPPLEQRAKQVFDLIPDWVPTDYQGQSRETTWTLPVTLASDYSLSGYQISWGSAQGEGISRSHLEQQALEPVLVLDESGHTQPPSEVMITYRRGRRTNSWRSPSRLTSGTKKGISRCRAGGTLTVVAYVQHGTGFQQLSRTWTILP